MPTPKTYSFSLPSTLTGNAIVDSLISGTYWLGANWTPTGPTNLSYSFMAPGTSYFVIDYSPDNEYNALYELTTGQKNAVTSALGAWSAVANLNFTLTTDTISNVGDMRFGGYRLMDDKTAAWAYFPSNTPVAGDVWIGPQTNDANPGKGSYDYLTFVHEIGHALGLKHPFDTSSTNNTLLDPTLDDVHFTVMSYNSNYSYQPTTPMVLDIIAIQSLYGANMAWQAGDTVYKWAANQSIFETIWDGGGNDTIDGSNQLAAVSINLNEGAYSQIGKAFVDYNNLTAINDGLAIAYGARIENAIGSVFNDILTGNALNNTLDGGAGADTMIGGGGNDTYYVDNIGDVIVETSASLSEIDTVYASLDWTLGANLENLVLRGSDNLNGTGNALNNLITGNAGNNTLDGGAGIDTLTGAAGDDIYIVDSQSDKVIETAGEGHDVIRSSVSYTLAANVEDGVLLGSNNLNFAGNALDNTLTGNAGNNILDGYAGADTMIGGDGNDLYYVDSQSDKIIEAVGEGHDVVRSSVSYTLSANIEDGVLLGSNNLNFAGNAIDNTLTGNAGNNILAGYAGNDILDGGAGTDTMLGGEGDDIYYVDSQSDIVTELAGEGHDVVRSSVSYTLSANIEDGVLLGSNNLNFAGNAIDNTLTGNAGNNIFDGFAGADTMIGGAGNDTYYVDNIGDVIVETSASLSEIDTVYASLDWTLGANLENLVLRGSDNLNGTGNALNNLITGNAGNNTLDGGAGIDTLTGAAGDDIYIVDSQSDKVTEAAGEGHDVIRSSVSYTLSANVEDGVLLGSNNLNFAGNALDNTLTGNAGNNILDGYAGADTMVGGNGDDLYYVDSQSDKIIEAVGEGHDVVRSSVSYTLSANIEDGVLLGSNNLNFAGNAIDNTLTGNAGNNILAGYAGNDILDGGAGTDTMLGGEGDDIYYVDNRSDTVTELAGEGHDVVRSTVSYTLSANVEDGVLLGSSNLNFAGNALGNTLTGNAGNNILDGYAGADTLIGGAGADTFRFSAVSDIGLSTNRDIINDFNSLEGDKIDLRTFDANLTTAGFNGFTFIGAGDFTGAGQLRFVDHVLSGNVNGNAGADFEIQLVGVNSFSANDLVA